MRWQSYIHENPRASTWYASVQRQPSWVVKAAIISAVVVFLVPVLLLTLAALVVFFAVFTILALVLRGVAAVQGWFGGATRALTPRDDGRRNVQVIDR